MVKDIKKNKTKSKKTMFDIIRDSLGYIPGMVNPNLLDNWYFGNPVNQRGQTNYSGNAYTIDRWKLWRSDVNVTLAEDGVTLSNTSADSQQFVQYFDAENTAKLSGKTVTLSVLMSNGHLYSATGIAGQVISVVAEMRTLENCFIQMGIGNGGLISVGIFCVANKTSNAIKAIKLELGEHQTLARPESAENWILNEMPNYGEQLARCQRYFQRIGGANPYSALMPAFTNSTTSAQGLIYLPVSLRTVPTVSIIGDFAYFQLLNAVQTIFPISSFAVTSFMGSLIQLGATISGANANTAGFIRANNSPSSYLDLSADL